MGIQTSLPCHCLRTKVITKKLTNNKFVNLEENAIKIIFSFLEVEQETLKVLLFNETIRESFGINMYKNDFLKISKYIKQIFKNKTQISFNKKIIKMNNFLTKLYSQESINLVMAIFLMKKQEYDLIIDINNNSFMLFIINLYFKISTCIYTKNNFTIKIILDKNTTLKNITEIIVNLKAEIKIDLYIPENFCYSSLSLISNSKANITITTLEIEKISSYTYGINMLEKKFENSKQKLKKLIIKEMTYLPENEISESMIYDEINLNFVCEILKYNDRSLKEIVIDTGDFINIRSEEFLHNLAMIKVEKFIAKMKISKINLEAFKKVLKKEFNYFDLKFMIREDDILDKKILALVTDYVYDEKIVNFPFAQNFLFSKRSTNLDLVSHLIKFENFKLNLSLNYDFITEEDFNLIEYSLMIKQIVDFISLNYIKNIRIEINKSNFEFMNKFIKELFGDIRLRNEDDIQIMNFELFYELKEDLLLDDVFEYFCESPYIKQFYVKNLSESSLSINKIDISPYFSYDFYESINENTYTLLERLFMNNVDENNYLICMGNFNAIKSSKNIFSQFFSTLSEITKFKLIFHSIHLNTVDTNEEFINNFEIFMQKLEHLHELSIVNNGKTHTIDPSRFIKNFSYLKKLNLNLSNFTFDSFKDLITNFKSHSIEIIDIRCFELKDYFFDEFCKLMRKNTFRKLSCLKLKLKGDILNNEKRAQTIADLIVNYFPSIDRIHFLIETEMERNNNKCLDLLIKYIPFVNFKIKYYN